MIDIDAFKQVNDRYGHPVGDQVLRAVAQRCRSNLREQHLLGRYGGDEFVGLLLECGRLEAELVAERLRRRVAEAPIETNAGALAITISTGCAVLIDDCANVAALIALADAALLAAKRARAGPS
jgi:diguanylate cyclase (GGDEF)-like protein